MFPRARIRRFNELGEKTPGVGSYNLALDQETKRGHACTMGEENKAQGMNVTVMEDFRKEKVSLERKIQSLKQECSQQTDLLQKVKQELDSCKSLYEKKLSKLQEKLSQQEKQLNTAVSEVYSKTLAFEEVRSQKMGLEEQMDCLKDENHLLKEAVKRAETENLSLEEQHANLLSKAKEQSDIEHTLVIGGMSDKLQKMEVEAEQEQQKNIFIISSQLKQLEKMQHESKNKEDEHIKITNELKERIRILEEEATKVKEEHNTIVNEMSKKTTHLEEVLENEKLERNKTSCSMLQRLQRVEEAAKLEEEAHIRSNMEMSEKIKCMAETNREVAGELTMAEQERDFEHDRANRLSEKLRLCEEMLQERKALHEEAINKMSEKMKKSEEETDYKVAQYTTMMDEMSEKIVELEEQAEAMQEELACEKEVKEEENWQEKYEELERKMEPFREIIDAFEVERKLIQDRDKFTQEQIDKLQSEAIKNMGHQNHKQKVKYVNTLKQENIALHQKYQASQEELVRQVALVKRYKQKIDSLEAGKGTTAKTAKAPKTPLKEANRTHQP